MCSFRHEGEFISWRASEGLGGPRRASEGLGGPWRAHPSARSLPHPGESKSRTDFSCPAAWQKCDVPVWKNFKGGQYAALSVVIPHSKGNSCSKHIYKSQMNVKVIATLILPQHFLAAEPWPWRPWNALHFRQWLQCFCFLFQFS